VPDDEAEEDPHDFFDAMIYGVAVMKAKEQFNQVGVNFLEGDYEDENYRMLGMHLETAG
jgi:hypothetical protein